MKITEKTKRQASALVTLESAQYVSRVLGVHFTCVHRWVKGASGITKAHAKALDNLYKARAAELEPDLFSESEEQILAIPAEAVVPISIDPIQAVLDVATKHPDKIRLVTEGRVITGLEFV